MPCGEWIVRSLAIWRCRYHRYERPSTSATSSRQTTAFARILKILMNMAPPHDYVVQRGIVPDYLTLNLAVSASPSWVVGEHP